MEVRVGGELEADSPPPAIILHHTEEQSAGELSSVRLLDVQGLFLRYVTPHLRWAFPQIVSYTRFVELMADALVPLCAYFHTRKGRSEGVGFIDSTLLAVCHPKRAGQYKVFAGLAHWGRNSLGWCYGFKLHS